MTDSKFDELVSLYLDRELPKAEVKKLRRCIARDPLCRKRFDEACRYYYAEKVAFQPDSSKSIAREIAVMRSRIISGRAHRQTLRGRYRGHAFPPAAVAAMAAALVALIALGQSVLNGPLQHSELAREIINIRDYFATDSRQKYRSMEPATELDAVAINRPHAQRETTYSTSLRLSGLSNAEPAYIAAEHMGPDWQQSLDEREPSISKKRLVLVLPRDALPERYQRENSSVSISTASTRSDSAYPVRSESVSLKRSSVSY